MGCPVKLNCPRCDARAHAIYWRASIPRGEKKYKKPYEALADFLWCENEKAIVRKSDKRILTAKSRS